MSTTSVFVEILIVGLESLIWLGLLAGFIWDLSACLKILKEWEQYSALITTLLLVLAYVLGIFIDRAADSIYRVFRYSGANPLPASVGKMRLRIMNSSEGMAKFLDYQRSRLRIARATVVNLFVIIIVGLFWMFRHYQSLGGGGPLVGILIMGVGIIILILALTVTRRIDQAQIKNLVEAYEIITEKKEDSKCPGQS